MTMTVTKMTNTASSNKQRFQHHPDVSPLMLLAFLLLICTMMVTTVNGADGVVQGNDEYRYYNGNIEGRQLKPKSGKVASDADTDAKDSKSSKKSKTAAPTGPTVSPTLSPTAAPVVPTSAPTADPATTAAPTQAPSFKSTKSTKSEASPVASPVAGVSKSSKRF